MAEYIFIHVYMHVCQTRCQVSPRSIDDLQFFSNIQINNGLHINDFTLLDKH